VSNLSPFVIAACRSNFIPADNRAIEKDETSWAALPEVRKVTPEVQDAFLVEEWRINRSQN
jgi:hypothetical protein